jgi:membrane fusion protein (multidrug efflux system)
MNRRVLAPPFLLVILVLPWLAGCSDSGGKAGAPKGDRPAQLVQLALVQRKALRHEVERTGTLRALQEAKIFNQEEGAVLAVKVHEGDRVAAGDVLARLDDRVLRAEYSKARAQREEAAANLKRLARLAERKLVSQETLEKARTGHAVAAAEERLLETRFGHMTVTAPFDGVISARRVNPGDVAPKHSHLFTLVDPTSLVTDVTVSELLLPRLAVGDTATVRIDALGDTGFAGRIHRIYPTVDPGTRRGHLEVVLDPVPRGASAGQFCRITLSTHAEERLVAPLAAVRRDNEGAHVYRVGDDDTAQRSPVVLGLRVADEVEVLDGLAAGDRVVVSGFLGLANGKKVKAVGAPAQGGAVTPPDRDGKGT